jgi:hypothetical protein
MPERPQPEDQKPQITVIDRETDEDGDYTVTFEIRPPKR